MNPIQVSVEWLRLPPPPFPLSPSWCWRWRERARDPRLFDLTRRKKRLSQIRISSCHLPFLLARRVWMRANTPGVSCVGPGTNLSALVHDEGDSPWCGCALCSLEIATNRFETFNSRGIQTRRSRMADVRRGSRRPTLSPNDGEHNPARM